MRTKYLLPTLVLAGVLILSACGPAVASNSTPSTLDVTSTGIVYVTPDIAYIYIGVHTENQVISQAVTANNTQAQAVVDALKGIGIDAKDIRTSNFSVYAAAQFDPMTGMQIGNTYMVDNTVYVTVRDLTKLPTLLNTAVQAGANNINSIQFDLADKTAALKEARAKAVENAAALAQELATGAGVTLGDIYNITYSDYTSNPYYAYGMGGGGANEAAVPSTPISLGQMQLSVSVSVSYSIGK